MKSLRIALASAAVVLAAAPALLGQAPQADSNMLQPLAAAQWGPAPPMLPPGAQIAVLAGNPMAAEPYTVRLKFPANYDVPAHSHPTDENVTVVTGTLYMGMGDKLSRQSGQPLPPGGFARAAAGMNHYAYTKGEVMIVLHGIGPVEFNYVNPADDPRNGKKTASK
jgi:quercetin dioxygenase-like cupin family protein